MYLGNLTHTAVIFYISLSFSRLQVKIKNVGVGIDDGIPLASVAVFHRIQIDTASVQANTQHTLTSTTDNNFKVSTTENTFQEETKVNLQVRASMMLSANLTMKL